MLSPSTPNESQKVTSELLQIMNETKESQENFSGICEKLPGEKNMESSPLGEPYGSYR